MATQPRRTGIDELGDQPWGTHFCLFYQSKEDLLDLLIPYFEAGLEAHEFCLCVASEPVVAEEVERALRAAVPNFARYLSEGQIEIISHLNWYLAGGGFDQARVRQGWIDKLDQALARGYSGMRFAANTFWLGKQDWQAFAEYEAKLDEVFGQSRILAMCAYALGQCSATDLLDVVHHHQFTIARRQGAWERLEGSELRRAQAEIRKLNADLEHQVEERTAQLSAANEQLTKEVAESQRSEEALRASEARLHAAIDAANLGLWDFDAVSGRVTWMGHQDELFGFAPGEFDGTDRGLARHVHPDDVEELNRVAQRARDARSVFAHEYRVIWHDGSIHWIGARGKFVYDETGKPVRMYGALRDVSARKQIEEALRRSDEHLRLVVNAIPALVWSAQPDGSVDFINQRHQEFTGLSLDDVQGWRWTDLIHPEDRARLVDQWRKALATCEPLETEARLRRAGGDYRWLLIRAVPLRDESGRLVRWYGTKTDIEDRKQAEEALRQSESELTEAQRIAHLGHWSFDVATNTVRWSEELYRIFDVEKAAFGGVYESFLSRVHPDDLALVLKVNAEARATGHPFEVEYRITTRNGQLKYIREVGYARPDGAGAVSGLFGSAQDITGHRRTQEALRKSERVLREAESLGHTGSWEQNLVTGEIFNTEENLRLFFGDDRNKGGPFEDYSQAVHPDDREFVLRSHAKLLAEGEPRDIEFRVVWPDGSVHVLFGRATVVRDESGQAIRVTGTNVDITDRKRAEAEMKRQAARAETLVRIAARLNKNLELEAVIHAVCEEAVNTFKVSQASMSLYDPKRDLLVYAGGVNIPPAYAATIEPITRTRFEELTRALGPIMVVPDIQAMADVPNVEFSSHLDVRTVVTVAMFRDQGLIGALAIGVNGHVREFAQDELSLLKAVGDQAAQAIANAQLLRAANEQHEQLGALSAKLAEAQEAERRAVARELHDEIGQLLYAVSASLQAIHITPDAATLAGRLADSAALIDLAIQQVRDLALELRPSMLDDFGLVSALTWLVDRQAQRSGFQADFAAEPPDLRLPASLDTAVYRIVQNALTNLARHARARHVAITVRRQGSVLGLLIDDDGAGFDVAAALERARQGATLGLLSMQERARLAGGTLEISSTPGQGTHIRARFPIDQPGGQ